MRSQRALLLLALIASTSFAFAQTEPEDQSYGRRNTFGVFASYSDDSSHILLGLAQNRKLLEFGGTYGRRLIRNNVVDWQYSGEFLPIALESDPVDHYTFTEISPNPYTLHDTGVGIGACHPNSGKGSEDVNGTIITYTFSNVCARRWTIAQGASPLGFQWNFRPRHKLQPFFVAHGGYLYSTQPIPVPAAGSFNFTFDFGVGLELFRSKAVAGSRFGTRSIRAEYRYHHISNADSATQNPGIDNGLAQITYAFGR